MSHNSLLVPIPNRWIYLWISKMLYTNFRQSHLFKFGVPARFWLSLEILIVNIPHFLSQYVSLLQNPSIACKEIMNILQIVIKIFIPIRSGKVQTWTRSTDLQWCLWKLRISTSTLKFYFVEMVAKSFSSFSKNISHQVLYLLS